MEECNEYPDAKMFVNKINETLKKIFLLRDLYDVNLATTLCHNKQRGVIILRMYCRNDNCKIYDKSDTLNIFVKMGIYPANYQETLQKLVDALVLFFNSIAPKILGKEDDTKVQEILKNMEVCEDFDDEEGGALF